MASPKQFKTAIVITGNADGAIKVTKATERQLGKLENRGKSVSAQLSNIAGTGIKYGAALAGAAAAGAAIMIKQQLDLIDVSAKTADKLGIATEKLAGLELQSKLTGVEQKTLHKGIQQMVRGIADAADGTGEAQDALAKLGLQADELKQQSPDQQFAAIADAMEGIETHADKVAIAYDLFGSRGVGLINTLKGGSAAALEAQQFTEQWGLALTRVDASKIEQANDAMTLVSSASEGFWKQLTVKVSPAITGMAKDVLGFGAEFGSAESMADKAFNAIAAGAGVVADIGRGLNVIWKGVTLSVAKWYAQTWEAVAGVDSLLTTLLNKLPEWAGGGSFQESELIQGVAGSLRNVATDMGVEFAELLIDKMPSQKIKEKLAEWEAEATAAGEVVAASNKKVATSYEDIIDRSQKAAAASKKEAEKGLREKKKSFEAIIGEVDTFLDGRFSSKAFEAFDQLGKSMFGVVDALKEMGDRQDEYNQKFGVLAELRERAGVDAEKLTKIEQRHGALLAKQASDQISAYGDIAGAAKGFFKEKTDGYKALEKAEMAFRAVELAMSLKSIAMNAAEVAAKMAKNAALFLSTGKLALSSSLTIPPPASFAAFGATLAALASIGWKGGSSGGASISSQIQESQGTGTVLGDKSAKSESAFKALDLMESHLDGILGVNVGMLGELQSLNANIAGLGNLLGRKLDFRGGLVSANTGFSSSSLDAYNNYSVLGKAGGASGAYDVANSLSLGMLDFATLGVGGKVGEFVDDVIGSVVSGISSKKSKKVDEGLKLAGGAIAEIMEQGVVDAFAYARIRTKKKKWGNTKTSYSTKTKELGDEISGQFGQIIGSIYGAAADFVDLTGVGSFASLTAFEGLKISTKGLSAEEAQAEIEAVLSNFADTVATSVMPAVVEFQNVGEGAFETLSRLATQSLILGDITDSLGMSLSRQDMLFAADAIAELSGGLESLAGNASNFVDITLSDAEKFERLGAGLGTVFAELGEEVPDTRASLSEFVRGLDLTTESGQQAFTAVTAASELLGEFFDQLEDYAGAAYNFDTALGIADGSKPLRDALAQVGLNLDIVETAAAGGSVALQALFADLTDTQKAGLEPFADAITALLPVSKDAAAILNERTQLETQLLQLQGNTAELRRREREAIDESNRALYDQIQALKDQQSAAAEAARAMEQMQGIAQSIREYLSGLAISEYQGNPLEQSNTAMQQFRALAQSALAGDAEAAQQLTGAASSALSLGEAAFASGAQFQALYSEVKNTLANVADNINIESYEEAMLRLQQEQIDALDALGNALTVELTATAKSEIEKLITFVTNTDQLPGDLKALALSAGGAFTKTVDFIAGQVLPVDLRNLALDTASTLTKTANFVVGSQLSDDLKRLALESSGNFIQTIDFVLGADLSHDNKLLALSTAGTLAKTVDFVSGQQLSPEIMELALAESRSIMTTVNAMLASDADVDAIALANLGDNFLSTTVTALLDSGSDQQAINLAIGAGGEILKYVKALKASGYDYQAASIAQAYSSTITKTIQASGGYLNADQQAILNALNGEANVNLDGDVLLRTDATMRDLLKGISDSTVQTVGAITELKYRLDNIIGKAGLQNIYAKAHYETFQKTLGDRDRVRVMSDWGKSLSDDRLRKFAKGGAFTNSIVDSPTRFSVGEMGEAGPEAIMPLHRGPDGSLGVRAQSPAFDDRAIVAEIRSHRQETEHQTRLNAEAARQTVAELKRLNRRVADIEAELETARVVS